MKIEIVNYNVTIDNEAIKAIRFVKGFNTDLRIKLNIRRDALADWLYNNRVGLLGMDFANYPDPLSDDCDKYERVFTRLAEIICNPNLR